MRRVAALQVLKLARVVHPAPWARLLTDESGQDLIEYALVAALIGVAVITAVSTLGNKIGTSFNTVGNNLTNAI
jgi:pilus assembly protein Flp/PilA